MSNYLGRVFPSFPAKNTIPPDLKLCEDRLNLRLPTLNFRRPRHGLGIWRCVRGLCGGRTGLDRKGGGGRGVLCVCDRG